MTFKSGSHDESWLLRDSGDVICIAAVKDFPDATYFKDFSYCGNKMPCEKHKDRRCEKCNKLLPSDHSNPILVCENCWDY